MKKSFLIFTVVLMLFCFAGCSKSDTAGTAANTAVNTAATASDNAAQTQVPDAAVQQIVQVVAEQNTAEQAVSQTVAQPVEETYEFPGDEFGNGSIGKNGAAACASPVAAQIAVDILKKGGNAVDAAVAMIYAVGLLEPAATGIGGAGQMLIYLADQDKYVSIEYMTQAPGAAIAGQIDTSSTDNPPSVESIAIPGQVCGTLTALELYGTMTPREVLQPVIDLARNGFQVTQRWNTNIEGRYDNLKAYDYTLGLYTDEGFLYEVGDTIRNNDLADTLELIADQGIKGFYDSEFTDRMVDYIQSIGGILTHEDFAQYKAVVREPISTTYRGHEIITTTGPSTGGTALLEALNLIEHFDLASYGFDSPETVGIMAEAFAMGYKDGNAYVADPAFYNCPIDTIISKEYADTRVSSIVPGKKQKMAAAGRNLKVTLTETGEQASASTAVDQGGTSHMVCMDQYGNVVSTTNTNGINFGSAVAVPGTGFVFSAHLSNLNNSETAGVNRLMPYIRVCSTTCPTIIADENGKPEVAIGSPGNWALVSAALAGIVNYIDFDMSIGEAINAPRTWRDGITTKDMYIEGRYSDETINALAEQGYNLIDSDLDYSSHVGCIAAIEVKDGLFYAMGDHRRYYGSAAY